MVPGCTNCHLVFHSWASLQSFFLLLPLICVTYLAVLIPDLSSLFVVLQVLPPFFSLISVPACLASSPPLRVLTIFLQFLSTSVLVPQLLSITCLFPPTIVISPLHSFLPLLASSSSFFSFSCQFEILKHYCLCLRGLPRFKSHSTIISPLRAVTDCQTDVDCFARWTLIDCFKRNELVQC